MGDLKPQSFLGKEIFVPPATVKITRDWRERFLSWPWKPWKVTKLVPNPALPPRGEFWVTPTATVVRQEDYMQLIRNTRANQDEARNG